MNSAGNRTLLIEEEPVVVIAQVFFKVLQSLRIYRGVYRSIHRNGPRPVPRESTQEPEHERSNGKGQQDQECSSQHGGLSKTYARTFDEVRAALAAVRVGRVQRNNRICLGLGPNVPASSRFVNFTCLAGDHA